MAGAATPQKKHSVYLFGWLGAKRSIVENYAAVWRSHPAISSANVLAPHWSTTLRQHALQRECADIASDVASGKPAVLHAFSTGGFLALAEVAWNLQDGGFAATNSLSGLVFDCGPGRVSATGGNCAGIAAALTGKRADSPAAIAVSTPALRLLLSGLLTAQKERFNAVNSLWDADGDESAVGGEALWNAPQLYLTSISDMVVPEEEIDAFRRKREREWRWVWHERARKSKHCELLREHPEWYERTLHRFLDQTA